MLISNPEIALFSCLFDKIFFNLLIYLEAQFRYHLLFETCLDTSYHQGNTSDLPDLNSVQYFQHLLVCYLFYVLALGQSNAFYIFPYPLKLPTGSGAEKEYMNIHE